MSNRVSVQACEFVDHHVDGTTHTHYGYRIYDDYGQQYDNTFDNIQEVLDAINEDNILDFIAERYADFEDAVRWKGGLYLNGDWVEVCDPESDLEV